MVSVAGAYNKLLWINKYILDFQGIYFLNFLAVMTIHSRKILDEKTQTLTLFSVVGLFFAGHFFRVFLDLKELYDTFESDAYREGGKDCIDLCASRFPLWTNVSIIFKINIYTL